MSQEDVKVIRRTYAAYNAAMSAPNLREAVRVVQESFADPEIEWVSEASVPEPQTYHGIDGVMEFFDGILDAFEYARQVPSASSTAGTRYWPSSAPRREVARPASNSTEQWAHLITVRDGKVVALVATARKLCVLCWHLLTAKRTTRTGAPRFTATSCARLELAAGDPSRRGRRWGSAASKREQRHERELSERFELAYRRLTDDWQPRGSGAGATRGRAS